LAISNNNQFNLRDRFGGPAARHCHRQREERAGVGASAPARGGHRQQPQDAGARGQPAVPADVDARLAGGGRLAHRGARRHQGHRQRGHRKADHRRRDGDQNQHGARRVPARRQPRQHPLLPGGRDEHGQHHVPDLAEAVPDGLRQVDEPGAKESDHGQAHRRHHRDAHVRGVEVHGPRPVREGQDAVHAAHGSQDRREQGLAEAVGVPGGHVILSHTRTYSISTQISTST